MSLRFLARLVILLRESREKEKGIETQSMRYQPRNQIIESLYLPTTKPNISNIAPQPVASLRLAIFSINQRSKCSSHGKPGHHTHPEYEHSGNPLYHYSDYA